MIWHDLDSPAVSYPTYGMRVMLAVLDGGDAEIGIGAYLGHRGWALEGLIDSPAAVVTHWARLPDGPNGY